MTAKTVISRAKLKDSVSNFIAVFKPFVFLLIVAGFLSLAFGVFSGLQCSVSSPFAVRTPTLMSL
jgi:hypothetical protein